jgi:hypothetical protein
MLVGAETNAIIEHRSPEGKRAGAKSMEDQGVTGPKHEELGPVSASQATSEDDANPAEGDGRRRPRRSAAPRRKRAHDGAPDPTWRKVLGRQRGGHPRIDWLSVAALGAGALLRRRKGASATRH